MAFEPNIGQTSSSARYIGRGRDLTAILEENGFTLMSFSRASGSSAAPAVVHVTLPGSSFSGPLTALDKQESVSNYLMGSDPGKWVTNVPNYRRVQYQNVYPGIDLVFYGNQRRIEHDFVVSPEADYRNIRVRLSGAKTLQILDGGALDVDTSTGHLFFEAPQVYQDTTKGRTTIPGHYRLISSNEFAFQVGDYDPALPLVIDPVLAYSSYLAGSNTDIAAGLAVDSGGNAYVTGFTFSIDFPTLNPLQATCNNVCMGPDVFVTKFNPSGSALVYSTYVGGSGYDQAYGIAVDSNGNALVVGSTSSFDFPQKNGLSAVISAYNTHGFAFSLNPSGTAFNFSTYLAGTGSDAALGAAVDSAGNAYVSGYTSSVNFPLTPGNQIGPGPGYFAYDLFVTKLSLSGALGFSTLIGGNSTNFYGTFNTSSIPLAVDSTGEVLLAGSARDGFPTTAGAYQPTYPAAATGNTNAFLGLLNNTGSAFLYATYLGGTGGDAATNVAIDSADNVYVTGTTSSIDFPTTTGSFQPTNLQVNGTVTFVTKMDHALSQLAYSTYLGGTEKRWNMSVQATGIAVDATGRALIVGNTNQSYLPLVSPVDGVIPQNIWGNSSVAFLSVLNSAGSHLAFSTFFSGSVGSSGAGVAVDSAGNAYITGTTYDPDLPTTTGAFQASIPTPPYQIAHAFVTKFSLKVANPAACVKPSILYFGAWEPGQVSYPESVTIRNCGTAALNITSVTTTDPQFSVTQNNCTSLAPGYTCKLTLVYSPTVLGSANANLRIVDNAPIAQETVQLSGYATYPQVYIYQNLITAPDEIVGLTSYPVFAWLNVWGVLPLHISSVVATGDFTAVNQCGTVVYPGQSCPVGVTFTPTAAGTRTGMLYIYDDAPGSPQVISLTGNGLTSYPTPSISSLYPGSALVGSKSVTLLIAGLNLFPTTTVLVNGKTMTSKAGPYPGEIQVVIPAYLLTKVSYLNIQVVNPAPGGASIPVDFTVYSDTALGAADVVYEPFTRKFYASIPATATNNPNSIVTFDPLTGIMGTPVAIGNDPGPMAVSADGTMLYIGLNATNSVLPFNLVTQTAGNPISLGVDPQRGALGASALQVDPADPNTVAVTLQTGPYSADGLALIQNGNVVTEFLNEPPNNTAVGGVRFLGSSDIFGWSSNWGQWGIDHFVLTNKGLLEAPGIPGQWGLGAFDTDGTNLYDVNGQIFNASTGALVGTFTQINSYTAESTVLTDTNSGRTFFTDQFGGVLSFDDSTLAQLGYLSIFNANSPAHLQHWGADGLAYLTQNYNTGGHDLIALRTSLFYPSAGPNPKPGMASISPSTVSAQGTNFVLTVNGVGFVPGAVVKWNGSARTTTFVNSSQLLADIPAADIALTGTVKITVVNPGPGGGTSVALSLTVQ